MANIDSLIKEIRKTTESTSFANSRYGKITSWISTGDYGLNRLISGDINKGIPAGKVVVFGGESQAGKSYILAEVIHNALMLCNYDYAFYFDSEGGALEDFFKRRGCPTNKIEHILVENVEDATVKILDVYSKIKEYKKSNPNAKFICGLDSFGALVATKLYKDADKGKQVSDMGGVAKLKNNLIKGLTVPALVTDTPIIITNHIYDDPSAMYPSKIKNQSGGRQVQYLSRIMIQCSKKFGKDDNDEEDEGTAATKSYKAAILKFFSTKNCIIRPFIESEMYLDFARGPMKYYGLIEPAMEYGLVVKPKKGWYQVVGSNDSYRLKDLILNKNDMWKPILEKLNEMSKEKLAYSSLAAQGTLEEELEDLEKEVEESAEAIENVVSTPQAVIPAVVAAATQKPVVPAATASTTVAEVPNIPQTTVVANAASTPTVTQNVIIPPKT